MSLRSLQALIQGEIQALEQTVALCSSRLARRQELAASGSEDILADSLAACLHSFYSGLEGLLETVASELDELPRGAHWHRQLLVLMTVAVEGARPAVFTQDSYAILDELRAFRHLFRNLYLHTLRPERVFELTAALAFAWPGVRADLEEFLRFLGTTHGPGPA
ncbi:MAG: hypothetical protein AB1634_02965 [Thermodesulfobacteriota bacterium]